MKTSNIILLSASVSGMLSVGIGAFGAHGLKPVLEATGYLDVFDTAVRYQFYHTLALLGIGILAQREPQPYLRYAAVAMIVGMFLFSGSLYVLSLTGTRFLGAITPIGGLCFILGWILLGLAIVKNKES